MLVLTDSVVNERIQKLMNDSVHHVHIHTRKDLSIDSFFHRCLAYATFRYLPNFQGSLAQNIRVGFVLTFYTHTQWAIGVVHHPQSGGACCTYHRTAKAAVMFALYQRERDSASHAVPSKSIRHPLRTQGIFHPRSFGN